ncbi:MAG TPA: DUF192 domain-containing protein [Sphingomonadaceae bacterium]
MKRIAFAVALGLAACSPQAQERAAAASPAPAQAASVHPVSGLQVIPLTISQNGNVHHFRVEVASTEPEQERGLMFREQMGPDEGMIFPHDPPRVASFWMKNTVIPLDIVFIGTDHRIINVSANATPYSLDPRTSDGLTSAVLELNGGRIAQLGFTPGALVQW